MCEGTFILKEEYLYLSKVLDLSSMKSPIAEVAERSASIPTDPLDFKCRLKLEGQVPCNLTKEKSL